MLQDTIRQVNQSEDGHAAPLIGAAFSMVGLILLGIGAANGTGWMAVAGGIVGALGAVATLVINHAKVDYEIYARLDQLEGKK